MLRIEFFIKQIMFQQKLRPKGELTWNDPIAIIFLKNVCGISCNMVSMEQYLHMFKAGHLKKAKTTYLEIQLMKLLSNPRGYV